LTHFGMNWSQFWNDGSEIKDSEKSVSIYDEDSVWTAVNSWKITPGNDKLTFEPDEITAEISFPRTNFTIKKTWNNR
jgi:hypothetical protein